MRPGVDFSIVKVERFAVRPPFSQLFVAQKLGVGERRNWIDRSLWRSLSEKRTRNRPLFEHWVSVGCPERWTRHKKRKNSWTHIHPPTVLIFHFKLRVQTGWSKHFLFWGLSQKSILFQKQTLNSKVICHPLYCHSNGTSWVWALNLEWWICIKKTPDGDGVKIWLFLMNCRT